jgi:signal peptidase I
MFNPKYVEDGRALVKAARRVINYRKDIARPEELQRLREKVDAFQEALKNGSIEEVRLAENGLLAIVGRVQPPRQQQGTRELVELIVVAVILALGIRAFYLQPFKIPTGSMQPTLNGVIGHRTTVPPPNLVVRAFEFLTLGRTYEDVVSQELTDTIVSIFPARLLYVWDGSVIQMSSGRTYQVGIDPRSLESQMGVRPGQTFARGDPIVRGYADLGDQLFVDKFSYNVFGPHRADVFVFRTNGIRGIPPGPDLSSEHYIKRLAGMPGDTLRIDQPNLFINGQPAKAYAFERVESQKNGYTGYRNFPGSTIYLGDPESTVTVPPGNFFALGDNNADSLDSRYWGFVPKMNVVGRGLFVYWPFSSHWGFVR